MSKRNRRAHRHPRSQAQPQSRAVATASTLRRPGVIAALGGAAVLGGLAFLSHRQAKQAELDHPPTGSFVEVEGVRLHYVERGSGRPLVLLHGNGATLEDFEASGLMSLAARNYRVIAFDRPGFGHSERPRSTIWTAAAQADLLHEALQQIGVPHFLLLGHSWGASVAASLALNHPEAVEGLILASGYHFPSVRIDAPALSGPAIPVIGDVLRYTVSPFVTRLVWPVLMRKIFGPDDTPRDFEAAVKELALRPSQIRSSAAESALMIPAALANHERYGELRMPVGIVVGGEDRLIKAAPQSGRLAEELPGSVLRVVPGAGHMVHHSAPEEVLAVIAEVAELGATGAADRSPESARRTPEHHEAAL
jgi:pimeloyl-ACP methyl ester carboxylesterase